MDLNNALQNAARQYCFNLHRAWGHNHFEGVGPQFGLVEAILADIDDLSCRLHNPGGDARDAAGGRGDGAR
jgi:hypothetical protein